MCVIFFDFRKLFRKLNALEPSDQFGMLMDFIYMSVSFFTYFSAKLANSCQKNDKHAYAALCWQAVAKCEESIGHNCEQALAHQKAARQFFLEFMKTESSGFISPYNEHLQVRFFNIIYNVNLFLPTYQCNLTNNDICVLKFKMCCSISSKRYILPNSTN